MAQASSSRTSNLSLSLSVQKAREEDTKKENIAKVSQKERKRQQQKAQQDALTQPQIKINNADSKSPSPWQVATKGTKTSLKDVLDREPAPSPSVQASKSLATPVASRPIRRTASPDTRFSGQQKSQSPGNFTKLSPIPGPSRPLPASRVSSSPIVPHSKSYKTPGSKAEPTLQLSMSDIIVQQKREQEVIKEAVAKRSLQEIQEEQAFQEWWDQESRRAQEQEDARLKPPALGPARGGKSGGGRGKAGGRGRGGGRGGRGGNQARADSTTATSSQGRGKEKRQAAPHT
jgi:inhibitor of Bruton tyrosine kinase